VTLKIRLRGFETHTRSRTLDVPTAAEEDIFRAAWELYRAGSWKARPVRLIGVGVSGWNGRAGVQGDLFEAAEPTQTGDDGRLDEVLDAIREKFGKGHIQRGGYRRR
jgi:DNA polymerase-4